MTFFAHAHDVVNKVSTWADWQTPYLEHIVRAVLSAFETMVSPVPDHFDFPGEEEKILELWKKIDAFQTSLKQSKDRPKYTFYDGPPFATGLPHYGHILAGTIKVSCCIVT